MYYTKLNDAEEQLKTSDRKEVNYCFNKFAEKLPHYDNKVESSIQNVCVYKTYEALILNTFARSIYMLS